MLTKLLAFLAGLFAPESKIVDAYEKLVRSMEARLAAVEIRVEHCEQRHLSDQELIDELRARIEAAERKAANDEYVIGELKRRITELEGRANA